MYKNNRLQPKDLKKECDVSAFQFETTQDIKPEEEIIDQHRAAKALDFGLNIKQEGFNIFVAGVSGTGRNTSVDTAVKNIANREKVPSDWCYLHNFIKTHEPIAIRLPAGLGKELKEDMEELIKELREEIPKVFESKDYEEQKRAILKTYQEKRDKLLQELEKKSGAKGFFLKQTSTGIILIPQLKGKPLAQKEYERLTQEKKAKIDKQREELQVETNEVIRNIRFLEKRTKEEIKKLDEKIALYAVGHLIDEIEKKYAKFSQVVFHLEQVRKDIIKNIKVFKTDTKPQLPVFKLTPPKSQYFTKYKVNLLVDHKDSKGAPVIKESNPTYYNLVGRIEYKSQFGSMTTDFTMIKPGAVHKANGGYLIVQALDVLRNFMAWEALKRIIKNRQINIEDINEQFRVISTQTLKPQPIPANIKVIMIGHPLIYHLLYIFDEDFRKLFKVKADYNVLMNRSLDEVNKYALFIATRAKKENLLPFTKDAVARIVEYGSRLVEDKTKLTAKFIDIADILREANFWALRDKGKLVKAKHIDTAVEEKIYRSNMIEERIRELIKEGTLMVDTEGEIVGQVNGISIIDLGDYSFGKPSRITAKTFMGRKGVIDIEREAKLSGKIHSKGVLIINSFLGDRFAQDKPLTLSGSICFEQLYEEVEGDSASSAEIYSLLSSLSGVAIRQYIAVTGSVDQRGQIQPVGRVNGKIEGFYHACKVKGLNGKQGVVIPRRNIKNLMLKDEVIKQVRNKKFHIYAIDTIEEGIEILTGIKAGKRKKDGKFPPNTIYYKVDKKLQQYAQGILKFAKK